MKYAFIQSQHDIFSVSRMCKILEVSRSAYYDWLTRPESARSREEKRLGEKVREIHSNSREIYGARRIKEGLVKDGEPVSRARVGRLMKLEGLESKTKRKFKATTNSNHDRPVAPNLLNRKFDVAHSSSVQYSV